MFLYGKLYMSTDICQTSFVDEERVAGARKVMPEEAVITDLADIFKALADPTRVRILTALSNCELCVCDLSALTGVSPSAVSHQLRLLRTARLVRFRRAGKMAYYRLDDDHVRRLLDEGLKHAIEG